MSSEEGIGPGIDSGADLSVQRVLDALNRRKWIAMVVFLCSLTAGVSIVKSLPDVYYADATVLIEHQQIPTQLIRSTVTTSESRLQTIGEEILTRARLQELINEFDLYPEAVVGNVPMERLVTRLRNEIWIDLKSDSKRRGAQATVAFTITVQGDDPATTAEVTNTLANLYVSENARLREQQAAGISHFLSSQVDELKKTLDEQESKLSRFKEAHVGELPHQQDINLRTLETLNTQLQQNLNNQVQVSERRASLLQRSAAGDAGPTVVGEPVSPSAQLAEMKQRLAQLKTTYSDRYPDVARLREEIAAREASVAPSSAQGPSDSIPEDPALAELKMSIDEEDQRLRASTAEAEGLRARIESYRRRVEKAPRVEQEYQLLSRDYDTTTELYRSLLSRQKEAELAENMEEGQKGEQFRVIEPAVASGRPAAPNRPRLWMVSMVLALGLAGGAAVLFEFMDSSFHSVDDLRGFTDIRLLGSIPRIDTAADRRLHKMKFVMGTVALALGLVAIAVGAHLYADGNAALTSMLTL